MTIYENVKALCDKKNISIMELEKKAGVGNGVVGGWRTATPNMKTLQKVADALGVSVSRLMK